MAPEAPLPGSCGCHPDPWPCPGSANPAAHRGQRGRGHCDGTEPWTVTSRPSLLIPALRRSRRQSGSCPGCCELGRVRRGFSWCQGVLWGAAGSSSSPGLSRSPCPCLCPGPARWRQPGTAGRACGGGGSRAKAPRPLSPSGNAAAVEGAQLLVRRSLQLGTAREHGHRDRVDLPRLLGRSRGRGRRGALWPPVLPGLQRALRRDGGGVPALPRAHRRGQLSPAGRRLPPTVRRHAGQKHGQDQLQLQRLQRHHQPPPVQLQLQLRRLQLRRFQPCPLLGARS